MPKSYESDFTKFIRQMKQNNPQIEEGQIKGRAILWDKEIDRDAMARYRESKVPQQAYVYQTWVGGPHPEEKGGQK